MVGSTGRVLVQRLGVDKSIVMPWVEEFIIFQEKYADLLAGGWDVVGR